MLESNANSEYFKTPGEVYSEFVGQIPGIVGGKFTEANTELKELVNRIGTGSKEKLENLFKYLGYTTFDTGLIPPASIRLKRHEYDRTGVKIDTAGIYIQGSAAMMAELQNGKLEALECYPHKQDDCKDDIGQYAIIKCDVSKLKFMNQAGFGDFALQYIFGRISEIFNILEPDLINQGVQLCLLNRLGGDEIVTTLKFPNNFEGDQKQIVSTLKAALDSIGKVPVLVKPDPKQEDPELDYSGIHIEVIEEPTIENITKFIQEQNTNIKFAFLKDLLNQHPDNAGEIIQKIFADARIIYDYGIISSGQIQNLDKILQLLNDNYKKVVNPNGFDKFLELDIRDGFLKAEHQRVNEIKNQPLIDTWQPERIKTEIDEITSRFTFLKTPFEDALSLDEESGNSSQTLTKTLLKKVLSDVTDTLTGKFTLNRNCYAKLLELGYFGRVWAFEIKPKGPNDISYFMGNEMIVALKLELYKHLFGPEATDIPFRLQPYLHLAKVGPTISLAESRAIPAELKPEVDKIFKDASNFKGFTMESGSEIIDFPVASSFATVPNEPKKPLNVAEFIGKLLEDASKGWYTNAVNWFSEIEQSQFLQQLNAKLKNPDVHTKDQNSNVEHWYHFFVCSRKKMYFEDFKDECLKQNVAGNALIQDLLQTLEDINNQVIELDGSGAIDSEKPTRSEIVRYYKTQAESTSKLVSTNFSPITPLSGSQFRLMSALKIKLANLKKNNRDSYKSSIVNTNGELPVLSRSPRARRKAAQPIL